ncbi:hypothetical protein RIF29_15361 [Crotalaria pallida]|uniref:Uncharacterized protein n=1 Tax=Crotalaria pallida TaxID=3830 RepID=A0AAN9FLM1_CROPI
MEAKVLGKPKFIFNRQSIPVYLLLQFEFFGMGAPVDAYGGCVCSKLTWSAEGDERTYKNCDNDGDGPIHQRKDRERKGRTDSLRAICLSFLHFTYRRKRHASHDYNCDVVTVMCSYAVSYLILDDV